MIDIDWVKHKAEYDMWSHVLENMDSYATLERLTPVQKYQLRDMVFDERLGVVMRVIEANVILEDGSFSWLGQA
jgi:hypothetical protein